MKIEEIVLVKEHLRNKTLNYLSTLDDFMNVHVRLISDSVVRNGQLASELTKTLLDDGKWMKLGYTDHKWVEARFCASESQLKGFLGGRFDNPEERVSFDEACCNAYCLDKVTNLGLRLDGSLNMKFQFKYQPVEVVFHQGDILKNFNGSDYRVMEKLSARNLLMMDERSGKFIVAIGAGMYAKYPKSEESTEDNQMIRLEWDHGIYLSETPSDIDFQIIREKYGEVKEIRTIEDYRIQQNEVFRFYKKIVDNPVIEIAVKEAATNAMYEVFMTGREDMFMENLNSGKYDQEFHGIDKVQKEAVR